MQRPNRVREDERGEDIEGCLLRHARGRREDDFLWLLLDDLEEGCALHLVGVDKSLEHGRLENAEPDPQADAHEDDRQRKRDAPTPLGELVTGPGAEGQYRKIGEEQTAGDTELRPGCNEPTLAVMARPFHRQ